MRRPGQYNLEEKRKQFKAFENKVKSVLRLRKEGKTFQAIANMLSLSTRQRAHYLYQDNKDAVSEQ